MTAPSLPPASKTCIKCHETKPVEAFRRKYRKCKACRYVEDRARERNDIERVRARNRARYHKNREQSIAITRAWQSRNPEKVRANAKAQRDKNLERERAKDRARHAKNPARKRANSQRWRRNNPQGVLAQQQRRRAQKYQAAINDFTAAEWREMQEAYDHRCAYCHKRCKGHLTQDHIISLAKGGNHTKSNIVPACTSCNCKKWTGAPLVPVQPLLL